MNTYPTNLTDSQRNIVDDLLRDKRPRKYKIRDIFDDIFYLLKTGCSMLPLSFPPWQTDYYYYTVWKHKGTIELIHEHLRDKVRIKAGKYKSPSLGLIDSQSVKTTRSGSIYRGINGGKMTKGRKRHIIIETLGLLLAVVVETSNEPDSKSTPKAIQLLKDLFNILIKIMPMGRGIVVN